MVNVMHLSAIPAGKVSIAIREVAADIASRLRVFPASWLFSLRKSAPSPNAVLRDPVRRAGPVE
jgi:hypothetical protein